MASNADDTSTFTKAQWEDMVYNTPVDKTDMNKLIMNYLIIEGYKDAAEKFAEECRLEPGVDLQTISDRMATRLAIQNGDVQAAMERANDMDPLILDQNPELYFHLQEQKLIELIRNNRVDEAIQFAQEELAPRGEENPEFLSELEKVMALLAFDDPSKSPLAELLDQSQRQKTASELNAAILTSQSHERNAKLPGILKLLSWSEAQLSKHATFPRLVLESMNNSEQEQFTDPR
eukprot:CAMPEP_0184700550 /NCGR_PEP_ID=MMETSP0313-20130426/14250_1 /TAXON_ID=2792 /ORGANISM="Porphyridium aerugineum, Strain SAG 1380-2" /LENGTH=233 /DNA_ID=CAMNT_0027160273 /DNA_START=10 /DNA_END=711 /DNA_ORIENTATION=+